MGLSGYFSLRGLVVTGALTGVNCHSLLVLASLNFASEAVTTLLDIAYIPSLRITNWR
jgi:hypothetical protein